MSTATAKNKRPRWLTEAYFVPADGPALTVDEENGVIKGVKVLGRYSNNRYVAESEGTEYTPQAMKDAAPLYEGADILIDHPKDRTSEGLRAERSSEDVFGQLRNVHVEGDEIRADLHYLKSHPMAPRVIEDVKRRLGVFGLSHNASAGKERFDRQTKRLVIESIANVRSVDLVRKPATNRNLWESHTVSDTPKTITFRSLLESQRKRFSKNRQSWMDRLLEMDDSMAVPIEEDSSVEPEDAMSAGFKSACLAVVDKAIDGEMDLGEALKKLKELLTAHDKLSGESDPEPATETAEEDDEEGKDKDKTESQDLKAELDKLKRKDRVRDLCETLNYTPTKAAMAALLVLDSDAERRSLIEDLRGSSGSDGKGKPAHQGPPRSRAPGGSGGNSNGNRDVTESEYDPDKALGMLRG